MKTLLKISKSIDWLNEHVGRAAIWLILVAVLISAGNAVVRKVFDTSSNAFLEIQWYLFSGVFLLCAGYTLLRNEHVRIDVVTGRLSPRAHAIIDIIGSVLFLLPVIGLIGWLSWPVFMDSFLSHERSPNAGGLIIWPVRLLVPVGFLLLWLQGVSELIKRIAFLKGLIPNPAVSRGHAPTPEDELIAEMKARGEIE